MFGSFNICESSSPPPINGCLFTAKADTAGVHGQRPEALETAAGVEAPDCRGPVKVGGKFNRAKRRLAWMIIAHQSSGAEH
jgi:hypothetical protein